MTLSREHHNTNSTLSKGYRERDDGVIELGSDDNEPMPIPPGNTNTQVPSKRGTYATYQENRTSPLNDESCCGNGLDSSNHDIHVRCPVIDRLVDVNVFIEQGLTSSADPQESRKRDVEASMFSDTDDLFQPSTFFSDMQPFKTPIEPKRGPSPSSDARAAKALPSVETEEVDVDIAGPIPPECSTANHPELSSGNTLPSKATPRARPVPIVVDGPFAYTDHLWDFAYRRVRRHTVEGATVRSDSIPATSSTTTICSTSTELDMPASLLAHDENLPSDTVELFPSADPASQPKSKSPVHPLALEDLHVTDTESGNLSVERHLTQVRPVFLDLSVAIQHHLIAYRGPVDDTFSWTLGPVCWPVLNGRF
jgi:hypothetical protein